jgi:SPP1 gp7 family putative phage head morphogenesis protein
MGQKIPMRKNEWERLRGEARERAGTVAGVASLDVIQSVLDSLADAIRDGATLDDFRADVGERLIDAWGGQEPGGRVENIFRTNLQSAYSAGLHKAQSDNVDDRPFWLYDATRDSRTTDICRGLHGTLMPAGDPGWDGRYAPCHYQCRATIIALTEEEARARGGPTGWPAERAMPGFGRTPTRGGVVADTWEPDLSRYDADLLRAVKQTITLAWTEDDHPRGKGGKFAPKGGGAAKSVQDGQRKGAISRSKPAAVGQHVRSVSGGGDHSIVTEHVHALGLSSFLRKKPLKELHVSSDIGRSDEQIRRDEKTGKKSVSQGRYSARTGKLSLRVPRPKSTYGKEFRPGESHSISSAAKTEKDAIQRTVTHEVAHHLYWHGDHNVERTIWEAYRRGNPITRYGASSAGEYFAESFAAYHYHPDALREHDPVGWNMVQRVLHANGMIDRPALARVPRGAHPRVRPWPKET